MLVKELSVVDLNHLRKQELGTRAKFGQHAKLKRGRLIWGSVGRVNPGALPKHLLPFPSITPRRIKP